MGLKRGLIQLFLILLIGAVVLASWLLIAKLIFKKQPPFTTSKTTSSEPKIELKTEYKNPFDQKTQYVNPFDQYKSPLYSLK